MVVAGSEFRHQALSELVPVREVLASVFFVSVGMLLDLRDVMAHVGQILGFLVLILGGKFILVFLTAALMRLPLRVGILTAASLAQVGEFSFVLLTAAKGTDLLGSALSNDLLVAIVLSMLITPIGMALGPRIACEAGKVTWLTRFLKVRAPEEATTERLEEHVIIAGYGMAGQHLAKSLQSLGRRYVVVDLNPENVRLANRRGEPVFYGDVTTPELLEELGIERARLLVIAVNDPGAAERAIRTAKRMVPDLQIVARTQYDVDIPGLRRAGATAVVSAEKAATAALRKLVRTRCERDRTGREPDPAL
jgi:CPA2 family monovalent cation:H+ antiporter-2